MWDTLFSALFGTLFGVDWKVDWIKWCSEAEELKQVITQG